MNENRKVDIVVVDDNQHFAQNLKNYAFPTQVVDCFTDPIKFLQELNNYPKDTKIILDHIFPREIRGLDIATDLHAKGYTHLYLLTGDIFNKNAAPEYLTVILKTDIDAIKKI